MNIRFKKHVIWPVFVKQRRLSSAAKLHIHYWFELLDTKPHLRYQIFGLSPRRRNTHRHELPHMPHLVLRENWLLRNFEPWQSRDCSNRLNPLQVCGRKHLALESLGNVEPLDFSMCIGASKKRDIQHIRQANIPYKLTPSAH